MRRIPPVVWLLAPLALGLLYAAGHAFLAPRPTLANLPPEGAILVQRYRNLDEVDRSTFGPRGPAIRPARELIGAERNLPGLPGVDHTQPVHMILMPRTIRLDSTMAVFGVTDAGAMQRTFDDPNFIEDGRARHAQHLVINGPWAAIAPNRADARRLGTGGITAADLGEDMAIAVDVPRLIDYVTSMAQRFPWNGILSSLGVDVKNARVRFDEATGETIVGLPGVERLARIGATWKTARMWAWMDEKRARIDLEPQPGPIASLLKYWKDDSEEGETIFAAPDSAELWLSAPGKQSGALLAQLVHNLGVDVQKPLREFVVNPKEARPGAVTIWAEPALGTGSALTFTVAAKRPPDLAAALPLPSKGQDHAVLPKGAAPITVGETGVTVASPKGEVWMRTTGAGLRLITFGADARRAIDRSEAHVAKALGLSLHEVPGEDGMKPLAWFGVRAGRAKRILGRALEPGGFLACLGGGDIKGTVSTNGRIVRLEARLTE